jgi:hypothetical protein
MIIRIQLMTNNSSIQPISRTSEGNDEASNAFDLKIDKLPHVPEIQAAKPVVSALVGRIDPDSLLAVADGLDEPPERG